MAGPTYGFTSVPINQSPVFLGGVTWGSAGVENALFTAMNLDNEALDKWTMTVSSTGPTRVDVRYAGVLYQYAIAASATGAAVVAALGALPGANVLLQIADIAAVDATHWTAIAKAVGVTFTMVATTNQAVSYTTTASAGTDIPQGSGVVNIGEGTGPGSDSTMLVGLPDNLTAQVQTITFGGTFNTGDQFDATVFVPVLNKLISVPTVTYVTDEAATLTALATAINTQVDLSLALGGLGVAGATLTCSTGSHTLIGTADEPGFAFKINVNVTNGAAGSAILVSDVPTTGSIGNPATDLNAAWVGTVPHSARITEDSSGNPVWKAGTPGPVAGATACHVTVGDTDSQSPTNSAVVYLYVSGANLGKYTFAAVDGAVALSRNKAQVVKTDAGGNVKLLTQPANY